MNFEPKEYQVITLERVEQYVEAVREVRDTYPEIRSASDEAWKRVKKFPPYLPFTNALGEDVPFFCLRVPTGGGKTYLAVRTIDVVQTRLLRRQTGLVVWFVPSDQIYRQTLKNLRTKDHEYRLTLDRASGKRTIIVEKDDPIHRSDIEGNLVVLVMKVQSMARKTESELRAHRGGSFSDFLPPEDDYPAHERLLKKYTSSTGQTALETQSGMWGNLIVPSLANVIRLCKPPIIFDESHRAKSGLRREMLESLNPSCLIELSATPDKSSNCLVTIGGLDLKKAQMIKLPINIRQVDDNGHSDEYEALRIGMKRLGELRKCAEEHEGLTREYIRPICLISVESSGEKRSGLIHAEDAKSWLLRNGVLEEEIAIKTGPRDDLKAVDEVGGLMSPRGKVKYIITVRALQEGWDCSFAYVLVLLNNPKTKTGVTQLVGRVMRQPFGRRSPIDALNQCYVISRKRNNLYDQLVSDLQREGLEELAPDVRAELDSPANPHLQRYGWRPGVEHAARHLFLPVFTISNGDGTFRRLDYEQDLASRIDWRKASLEPFFHQYTPSERQSRDVEASFDLTPTGVERTAVSYLDNTLHEAEPLHVAKDLMDLVPNPWVAYEIAEKVLKRLNKDHGSERIKEDLYAWSAFLRMCLSREKDTLAKEVFLSMMESGELHFVVITDQWGERIEWKPPEFKYVPDDIKLLKGEDGQQLKLTLFDPMSEDAGGYSSSDEKEFVRVVDEHKKIFLWYRNIERKPEAYSIQGWHKHRVFPDFVLASKDKDDPRMFERVYVVETKGAQLIGNSRSDYVKAVLALCNKTAKQMSWHEVNLAFEQPHVRYEYIPFENWKMSLEQMLID